MSFTLHPYQNALSLKTRQALKHHRKVLMCSPTGSGKTVVAADIFARAHNKNIKPVFLTDRIEIAKKTKKTFEQFGLSVQLVTADTKQVYKADCIIAMAETFYRRCMSGWFPKHIVKLLFCDEAHMSVFNKSIDLFPEAYIVGLTATPVSAAFNLNKTYDKIIMGPTTPELIQSGHLCPSIDIGQKDFLELKYERGDFSQESQREAFSSYGLSQKMLTLWKRHAYNRSTICYNIDLAHNEEIERIFKAEGISTCSITGKTNDEERTSAIRDYNMGKIQVMLNVGVATKGFDSPITSCIIANFSTASLAKHMQVAGRGARLHPGKENFVYIDMGNNIMRHGSYNGTWSESENCYKPIDWEYLFHNPEQDIRKTTPLPKHLCNVCLAYISNIHAPVCPVCDSEIVIKKLVKLESMMPEELANKDIKAMTLQELITYAKFKGYKRGWYWRQNEINQLARRSRMRQGRLF